ncbi:hypothetical protein PanWU01x14_069030 [Parasponia andersonii]|uniref:Uncharacterized protein n=1 Tax=Parasponia andersonii TaxID=3476 RepID=A0A2P5DFK7_PARAD|nr:hypothetical protein PanWU01x14_069030 [Parasponia andersonii]
MSRLTRCINANMPMLKAKIVAKTGCHSGMDVKRVKSHFDQSQIAKDKQCKISRKRIAVQEIKQC